MNLVTSVIPLVVMPLVFGGMLYYFSSKLGPLYRAEKARKRILEDGVPAHALVIQYKWCKHTWSTREDAQCQVELSVEVHRPGTAPYAAVIKTLISAWLINQVQAGNWLGVRVDPADPQNVVIEKLAVRPPATAPQLSADAERRRALLVQHFGTEMRGAEIPMAGTVGTWIALVVTVVVLGVGICMTILRNHAR